jgi:hypothetical protein
VRFAIYGAIIVCANKQNALLYMGIFNTMPVVKKPQFCIIYCVTQGIPAEVSYVPGFTIAFIAPPGKLFFLPLLAIHYWKKYLLAAIF